MSPLRKLRARRTAFAWLLAVYPVATIAYAAMNPSPTCNEVFPCSSFALFVFVPGEREETVIEVFKVDGEHLPEPVLAHERPDLFPAARDAKFYLRTQEILRRRLRDNPHVDFIERQMLAGGYDEVKYRIVTRSYDPLGGIAESRRVVGLGVARYPYTGHRR